MPQRTASTSRERTKQPQQRKKNQPEWARDATEHTPTDTEEKGHNFGGQTRRQTGTAGECPEPSKTVLCQVSMEPEEIDLRDQLHVHAAGGQRRGRDSEEGVFRSCGMGEHHNGRETSLTVSRNGDQQIQHHTGPGSTKIRLANKSVYWEDRKSG